MQADDDKQMSDAVTNAAISVEVAASKVIETASAIEQTANNIEVAAFGASVTLTSIEKGVFDVSMAETQQAADISAARIAEVRAEVLRDNAELRAGQYKRL